VYQVKHGEKTLMFKKKGEGETPKTETTTEVAPTETTPKTTQPPATHKFRTVATAGMVWKAKTKGDS
jgi:hypothetical protein